MCSANKVNGGDWVFVFELQPDAALTTGRSLVERLTTLASVPVIIINHDAVPPEDKGDRVVVKESLKRRSGDLVGAFLSYLDDVKTMGVYELVVH